MKCEQCGQDHHLFCKECEREFKKTICIECCESNTEEEGNQ